MPFNAFNQGQKDKIKNHIPTVLENCKVFLSVFDANMNEHDEDKAIFLKGLIDVMEIDLQEVKDILDTQIP